MPESRVDRRQFLKHATVAVALAILVMDSTLAARQTKQGETSKKAPRVQKTREKTAYDPTDRYQVEQIQGWTVVINKSFLDTQPELAKQTRALLREQLRQVVRRVPAEAVKKLRTIRIWVEEKEPHHPCMTYHPNIVWLKENGMNPDKARCVEVANARNFLEWIRQQPWMVLHELAHGYHHQFLDRGFENAAIQTAFRRATEAKRYESVPRNNGKTEKAYAATNAKEYFAEASEAYFGTNDFYPFVRAELKKHDPDMFRLLEKLWHPVPQD